MNEYIHLHRDGDVARLVLDRPPLNILHIPMLREIEAGLVDLGESTRLFVISGAGRAFSAGVDVGDHTVDRVEEMLAVFHGVIRRLLAAPFPVVAAVRGPALGGGCELALACDLVVASEDARLGQPEIRLAVFPPVAAALLPRLIGPRRALDLILTGRTLPAEEALQLGLVSRVVPSTSFETEVEAYVTHLAGLSRPVLQLTKQVVHEGMGVTLAAAVEGAEERYLNDLMRLRDPHEGLAAFLEKRTPVWKDA